MNSPDVAHHPSEEPLLVSRHDRVRAAGLEQFLQYTQRFIAVRFVGSREVERTRGLSSPAPVVSPSGSLTRIPD